MPLKEQDILTVCKEYLMAVRNNTERGRRLESAGNNRDYYRGAQWAEEEYNGYKSKGVNTITVNRILPAVNNVSGQQQANRQDLKVRPRRGGKETVASIYTALIQHTMDQGNGEYAVPQCFHDGLYLVESFLFADIDPFKSEGGSIQVSHRNIFNTAIDPDAKEYDPNISAKYAILWDWMDKKYIEVRYPESEGVASRGKGSNGTAEFLSYMIGGTAGYDSADDLEVETEDRIKVFRFFWWETVRALQIRDKTRGSVVTITDPDAISKYKKQLKQDNRYRIQEVPGRRLHRSVICDDRLMEDTVDPFGDRTDMLPLSRFSPYWNNGVAFGIVDNIRPLNYEENVFRTEATRFLKQTANSGWITNGGNEADKRFLEQFGSVNGLVIDRSKYGGSVEKISPNPFPQGHMEMAQQFALDGKEVSAVNDALMGYDTGRNESGRAIDLKQRQGMTTQQPLFNAFDSTLRVFGNFLLRVIQNTGVYSEDEIREIVGQSGLISNENKIEAEAELRDKIGGVLPAPADPRSLLPNTAQLAVLQPQDRTMVMQKAAMGIQGASMYLEKYPQLLSKWTDVVERTAADKMIQELKDSRVSDYWVKVTLSPSSQTTRLATLAEMSEISRIYPGVVPPDLFVEATDLPNKEAIMKRLQQPQVPTAAGVQT